MTDIVVTAAQVGVVDPLKAHIKSYVAGATITKGQAVYLTTAGLVGVADANGSAPAPQFRGVALNGGGAGQAIDVLHDGECYGFTISGLNVGALVYLSDEAGKLADAAATNPGYTVVAGRVSCLADKDKTKVLRIQTNWLADWAQTPG